MSGSPVDPRVLAVALDNATGQAFEDFVNEFNAALVGAGYVPVGGMKDGGADAYITDHLRTEVGRPGNFLQASITAKVQTKISQTVNRLREVGREPKLLTYFSSRVVTDSEAIEHRLSSELILIVRIRDRRYISAQINHSVHTRAAFDHHLAHFTAFLKKIGASPVIGPSKHVDYPDVFVFLRQEVDRRDGSAPLVDAVLDTLVVWALEGTDPDQDVVMTADDIRSKILGSFPSAKQYVDTRLTSRLQAISSKSNPYGGRLIKWHSKKHHYVLPYETRERVALDNAEDESLRTEMVESLKSRFAAELGTDLDDQLSNQGARIALQALQRSFEREGLAFARFVSRENGGHHYHYLSDAVAETLAEERIADKRLIGSGTRRWKCSGSSFIRVGTSSESI
jgi:hypothetical protein